MFYFFILLFCSCRKDQVIIDPPVIVEPNSIVGDTTILVGSWKWLDSEHTYNWCYGSTLNEVLDSTTESANYKIEILQKGQVNFYQNTQIVANWDIYFASFGGPGCNTWSGTIDFEFDLDNMVDNNLNGCVNQDSLIITAGFPFENYEEECEYYLSYFKRE